MSWTLDKFGLFSLHFYILDEFLLLKINFVAHILAMVALLFSGLVINIINVLNWNISLVYSIDNPIMPDVMVKGVDHALAHFHSDKAFRLRDKIFFYNLN